MTKEEIVKVASFDIIQQAYWESVIIHYVESWGNEEEKEKFLKCLNSGGMEIVINQLLNDDAAWQSIDESIEYFITHLF